MKLSKGAEQQGEGCRVVGIRAIIVAERWVIIGNNLLSRLGREIENRGWK